MHSWPPLSRRRTMFPPMRPSPIIPICMVPPFSTTVYTPASALQGNAGGREDGMIKTGIAIAKTVGLVALSFIFLGTPGRAEVATGAKAGTLGLGAELTVGLSPQVNVRL